MQYIAIKSVEKDYLITMKNMFVLKLSSVLMLMVALTATRICAADDEHTNSGLRTIMRMFDDCRRADSGFSACIKRKAITFVDRVQQIDTINMSEGIKVERKKDLAAATANEVDPNWEQRLPTDLAAKDEALSNVLMDKVVNLVNERSIKITFPNMSPAELGRGLEEGNYTYT